MRHRKFKKILSTAMILVLLMLVIPAAPALAYDYDISLSVSQGIIGTSANITGTDFAPGSEANEKLAYVYLTKEAAAVNQYIDSQINTYKRVSTGPITWADDVPPGAFEIEFDIPSVLDGGSITASVSPGTYYVCVTVWNSATGLEDKKILAVAPFSVIGGELTLNVNHGTVDTPVTITGSDLAASQALTIKYDGYTFAAAEITGDTSTNSVGTFESTIYIPESTAGAHTITVTVNDYAVTAEFTVEPDIIITPQSGEAGDTIIVNGTGFVKRPKMVYVYFNNVLVASVTPSSYGSITTTFLVPDVTAGSYSVEAEDDDGNLDNAPFTVIVITPTTTPPTTTPPTTTPPTTTPPTTTPPTTTPPPTLTKIKIDGSSNAIGEMAGINGENFAPEETVTVKWDEDTLETTATTNTNGVFQFLFFVPVTQYGSHTVTATDESGNEAEFTFTVPSKTHAAPLLVTPETGAEVESPAIFDWADATDFGRQVTYTLQIASNINFTASTVLLDKTGLSESTYTLSNIDELALANTEILFWRVRAVDLASNPSQWTDAGQFYFEMTSDTRAAPQPLLPTTGATVKSPAIFDWSDATDFDKPVTYTLQISNNINFTVGTILLEKKGISASTYTLTEADETAVSGYASLYYRVMAIDQDANQSVWTTASQFSLSVGSPFPSWAIYTLMGIGAVLLFGIGYWLGRRTGFYY